MRFHKPQLEPSYSRSADFEGDDLSKDKYGFECGNCGAQVFAAYGDFQTAAWSWNENLPEHIVAAAKDVFQLNMVGRSHDGSLQAVILADCSDCGDRYLVYAGVDEGPNSYYRITVQGIVRIIDERDQRAGTN